MSTSSPSHKIKVLAVDDEPLNLDLLNEYLSDAGYEVLVAEDGETALSIASVTPDISAIVLDRMMPGMDGVEVVKRLNTDYRLKEIPVVMQTAASGQSQILEGVEAGVYYYLTKPYDGELLVSIVNSAITREREKSDLRREIDDKLITIDTLTEAIFRVRTLEDAKRVSNFVSNCCPDPYLAAYGINELLVNSIEHGNLGISFDDKTRLVAEGRWIEEVEARLNTEANNGKFVTVQVSREGDHLEIRIKDQGDGFDWSEYLEASAKYLTQSHGRGISTSRKISFSELSYLGAGNEVLCKVALD